MNWTWQIHLLERSIRNLDFTPGGINTIFLALPNGSFALPQTSFVVASAQLS